MSTEGTVPNASLALYYIGRILAGNAVYLEADGHGYKEYHYCQDEQVEQDGITGTFVIQLAVQYYMFDYKGTEWYGHYG